MKKGHLLSTSRQIEPQPSTLTAAPRLREGRAHSLHPLPPPLPPWKAHGFELWSVELASPSSWGPLAVFRAAKRRSPVGEPGGGEDGVGVAVLGVVGGASGGGEAGPDEDEGVR